jgi:hypothetical protein
LHVTHVFGKAARGCKYDCGSDQPSNGDARLTLLFHDLLLHKCVAFKEASSQMRLALFARDGPLLSQPMAASTVCAARLGDLSGLSLLNPETAGPKVSEGNSPRV